MQAFYTVGHKNEPTYFFVCNFVNSQWISMLFSQLDLKMNGTCDGVNLSTLMLLCYLVKIEMQKMHANTISSFNVNYKIAVK